MEQRDLARAFGTADREQWTESQRRVVMRIEWLEKAVAGQQVDAVRTFQTILRAVRVLMSVGFDEATAIDLIIAERRKRGLSV